MKVQKRNKPVTTAATCIYSETLPNRRTFTKENNYEKISYTIFTQ